MILSMRSGLAVGVVLLALAGPAAGQEIRPTLDKIKETGVIQLGYVAWVPVTPGSTTITFGRMEQVAFSHMISVDGGSLLATADSGIGTVKDLAGERVGVIPNTTTEKALTAALAGASIQTTVIPVAEIGDGLRGLEEGRLDAYASDRLLLAGRRATAKNPANLRLTMTWTGFSE